MLKKVITTGFVQLNKQKMKQNKTKQASGKLYALQMRKGKRTLNFYYF